MLMVKDSNFDTSLNNKSHVFVVTLLVNKTLLQLIQHFFLEEKSLTLIFIKNQRTSNMPSQYMGYIQDNEAVDINFSSSLQKLQHNRAERGLEQKLHTFPISQKYIIHMTISTVNQKEKLSHLKESAPSLSPGCIKSGDSAPG